MKLRGGLWVPDTSDAEALAAQVTVVATAPLDSKDRESAAIFLEGQGKPVAAKSSEDTNALVLAARFNRPVL